MMVPVPLVDPTTLSTMDPPKAGVGSGGGGGSGVDASPAEGPASENTSVAGVGIPILNPLYPPGFWVSMFMRDST